MCSVGSLLFSLPFPLLVLSLFLCLSVSNEWVKSFKKKNAIKGLDYRKGHLR